MEDLVTNQELINSNTISIDIPNYFFSRAWENFDTNLNGNSIIERGISINLETIPNPENIILRLLTSV